MSMETQVVVSVGRNRDFETKQVPEQQFWREFSLPEDTQKYQKSVSLFCRLREGFGPHKARQTNANSTRDWARWEQHIYHP